ncbi:MAG: maleylacetoacetate isomerase [Pseudomonadota bacterium]
MAEPTLYDFWRSSASYRVRIALNLAGIAYKTVSVDLVAKDNRAPEHMARNPQGLVPVLELDGNRFTQSLAIIEYLNEARGLGWLPDDPAERAGVRALAYSVAVDVHPVCNVSVAAHVSELTGGTKGTRKAWSRHFIGPGLAAFEQLLAGFEQAPYCAGATVSLADICLVPQVYNAERWDIDFEPLPRIRAVTQACRAHPAFAAADPDAVKP